MISSRALQVLNVAARKAGARAIWLDAFCVPSEEPERATTLRRLASIYGGANEVLVVLSEGALSLFEECQLKRAISAETLQRLEDEAWVRRFWTYQELARSRRLSFAVEGNTTFGLDGADFLNHVGEALWRASASQLKPVPALENVADVLAAWMHTGSEPFAYQVMAGMQKREAQRPADRFNAVLGAIDPDVSFELSSDLGEAAERFMLACEAKGDLSFIYSTGGRSDVPGRSWRPVAGEIRAIHPWNTFGNGQRGVVAQTHVVLEDIHTPRRASLTAEARTFIAQWLGEIPMPGELNPQSVAVARALVSLGCATAGAALELESGYFFPATDQRVYSTAVVLVASGVRWVHGSPGLLAEPLPGGRYRCLDVGVFVGPPGSGACARIELE